MFYGQYSVYIHQPFAPVMFRLVQKLKEENEKRKEAGERPMTRSELFEIGLVLLDRQWAVKELHEIDEELRTLGGL